jgi:UDP-glucose 4-epimerase
MKVLVTGGAGFIGSHLSDLLVDEGHHVIALDDLSTGSQANVQQLYASHRFQLIVGDVRDLATIEQAALAGNGEPPEVIFHLAAAVGVKHILAHPRQSLETNLRGAENVLRVAAGWQGKVVIASTSEVYGKNDSGALREDSDRVLGDGELARWWYAVAKMADEGLALAFHREDQLHAIIVRLFNTVGPRQTGRYGMVLPTLVHQALDGQALTVFGDGEQTRCFTYVADAVRALLLLAQTEAAYGRVFNIGQGSEISINRLAQRILNLTGSQSSIAHIPYREAYGESFEDMRRRVPDCQRLAQTIGFTPSDRLDEAIRAVSDEYRRSASCAPA